MTTKEDPAAARPPAGGTPLPAWNTRRRGGHHHEGLPRYLDVLDSSRRQGGTGRHVPRRVDDVMSSPVVAVRVHAPFKVIAETLAREHISAAPVLDADSRVVGVVSEADLLAKSAGQAKPGWREMLERPRGIRALRAKGRATTAADLMTTPAVTVTKDAPVRVAARLLALHRIKRLPVVDSSQRLTGVVSRADLLRIFLRPDADIREEIISDVLRPSAAEAVALRVEDGVVTLAGQVELRSMVHALVTGALAVDGVVQVVEKLQFAVDDTVVGPLAPSRR